MSKGKPRLVPRLYFHDFLDLPATETWLADLAAKGLHFRKIKAGFVWFERGEPAAVRYRLDAVSPISPPPEGDRAAYAEAGGWHYIAPMDAFSVYLSSNPAAPELHTDPVTQSYTMDKLARRLKWSAAVLCALTLATVLMVGFGLFLSPGPTLTLIQNSTSLLLIFTTALNIYQLFHFLSQTARFLSLRRRLRAGVPFHHAASRRWQVWGNLAGLALVFTFAALSWFSLYRSFSQRGIWSITAETPSPLPFHLVQVEDRPDFQITHDYIGESYGYLSGLDGDNLVDKNWSMPAPVQYIITERGEVPGLAWPDGSGPYRPTLRLYYYELSLPFLAEPLMDDLIYRELDYFGAPRKLVREWRAEPGLDQLLLVTEEDGSFQQLFARRGGRVLRVSYYGLGSLSARIPEVTALLNPIP